jgi:MFS family permease
MAAGNRIRLAPSRDLKDPASTKDPVRPTIARRNSAWRTHRMTARPRASTRLIVTVLAASGLIAALMQTLLVPLIPELPALLHVSAEDTSWLITATLLASAVAIPSLSRLADMHGKRRMVLVSLTTMATGSVLGALNNSLPVLITARAMQGLGMAIIPIAISIMRDELPRERLGSAVALMSATLGIGAAVGLPLSGLIYTHLGWHALFWVSAVTATLMLVVVLLVVPESSVSGGGRFDHLGAALLSIVLVCLLLGITKGGHWGWTSPRTLLTFASSLAFTSLWIPWEMHVGQPLVDVRTSARRPVLLTNIASLLVGFAMYCNMLSTTEILQMPTSTGYGFGLTMVQAGVLMLPSALMMVVIAPVSASITRIFGAKVTLGLGAAVLAGGYVLRIAFLDQIWQIVVGAMIVSSGTAIAYAAMPVLIMRAVPVTETAAANGLNTVLRSIGTSSASAAFAAILTGVTLTVGQAVYPSQAAFQYVFVLAAVAAACGGLVTLGLPRHRGDSDTSARAAGQEHERVLHGRVLAQSGEPVAHGRVTLSHEDAEPVDWGRTDERGRFTVAVSGDGRYLIVVEAQGWMPTSTTVTVTANYQPFTVTLQATSAART